MFSTSRKNPSQNTEDNVLLKKSHQPLQVETGSKFWENINDDNNLAESFMIYEDINLPEDKN